MSFLESSLWSPISGGIAAPRGFQAAGITAGLKVSNNPDLALIVAPYGAVCSGTFTTSSARAECINLAVSRLESTHGAIRAILINSGQANACTGKRGLEDSLLATKTLANRLELNDQQILICSTGVIGDPIPIQALLAGIDPLVAALDEENGDAAAKAILTTDLVEKQIAFQASIGGKAVRIGGMAKGSGMIHPNMATMLAFLTCDAFVPQEVWCKMVKRVVNSTFNCISVDGDTSTNDACLAFAAGELLSSKYFTDLEVGLMKVASHLAKAIVRDGEGANCLMEVTVDGAKTDAEARFIARAICSSSLVKTAIHGCDPNWGRIIAAAGRADISFSLSEVSLSIGEYMLLKGGLPIAFKKDLVAGYMREKFNMHDVDDDALKIRLIIGKGNGSASAWGCDFSKEYVRINADYTT